MNVTESRKGFGSCLRRDPIGPDDDRDSDEAVSQYPNDRKDQLSEHGHTGEYQRRRRRWIQEIYDEGDDAEENQDRHQCPN